VTARKTRIRVLAVLAVVTALGLALKFYAGPGRWWVNNWGPASVAYELFFMLLVFLFVPRRSAIAPIAVVVCVTTCALELLQTWKPPWLEAVRAMFLGRTLLGTSFSWWDMPAYVVGCLLGWWLLHRLAGGSDSTPQSASTL